MNFLNMVFRLVKVVPEGLDRQQGRQHQQPR